MTGTNNLANQADVERFLTSAGVRGDERRDVSKAFNEILFRLRFNHVSALDNGLRLPHDYKYPDANLIRRSTRSSLLPSPRMGRS